ncbi:hypothetical protein IG631_02211 [Alternaria alternata]|nr:hypothetical protein IG631_02211 [Alternaria alternata]
MSQILQPPFRRHASPARATFPPLTAVGSVMGGRSRTSQKQATQPDLRFEPRLKILPVESSYGSPRFLEIWTFRPNLRDP